MKYNGIIETTVIIIAKLNIWLKTVKEKELSPFFLYERLITFKITSSKCIVAVLRIMVIPIPVASSQ
jgi:hypothetical protein